MRMQAALDGCAYDQVISIATNRNMTDFAYIFTVHLVSYSHCGFMQPTAGADQELPSFDQVQAAGRI